MDTPTASHPPPRRRPERLEYQALNRSLSLITILVQNTEANARWQNYTKLLFDPQFHFYRYFLNSVIASAGAVLLGTTVATMAGYGFGRPRYDFRGRGALLGFLLLALMLGLLPLLLYNLQTGGTLDVLFRNVHTSYYGVNNLAYISNLRIRWDHLRALLNGSSFWYLGGPYRDPISPLALWLSAGIILAHTLRLAIRRPSIPRPAHDSSDRRASGLRQAALMPAFPLLMMALRRG